MLYLITNRHLVKNRSLVQTIEEAVKGGVNAIILREKDLSSEELLVLAKEIKEVVDDKNTCKLIINTNLEVAKEVCADGYHTGFTNFISNRPEFQGLLGVSVHTVEEAIRAEKEGASYLLASNIFPTECKKGLEPKGIDFIKKIKSKVNIPVIALGGINKDNAQEVMKAGANEIAVMSAIMNSINPYLITKEFKDVLNNI